MGRNEDITGSFGAPGESENGGRVADLLAEMELVLGNTYFEHKSTGMEVVSMRDLVLVRRDTVK